MIMPRGQQLLMPVNPLFIWASLLLAMVLNMVPLGALSFPLYAVHMPVIQGMGMLLGYGWLAAGCAALAAGIALTLAAEAVTRHRRRHRRKATA